MLGMIKKKKFEAFYFSVLLDATKKKRRCFSFFPCNKFFNFNFSRMKTNQFYPKIYYNFFSKTFLFLIILVSESEMKYNNQFERLEEE